MGKEPPTSLPPQSLGNRRKIQRTLRNWILCGDQIKYLVRPIIFEAGPQQDSASNIAAARSFFARSAMSCFLRDLLTR